MIICVTKSDIKRGVQNIPTCCPIALAMKRRFPRRSVFVRRYYVKLSNRIYSLPASAVNFVNKFDHDRRVRPFRFTLPIK